MKKDAALAKTSAKHGDVLAYDVPKRKHVAWVADRARLAPVVEVPGQGEIAAAETREDDSVVRCRRERVGGVDGTGLERVTYNESFDGFPMFSPDGKKLVFASNRNDAKPGDTNIFIADWVN